MGEEGTATVAPPRPAKLTEDKVNELIETAAAALRTELVEFIEGAVTRVLEESLAKLATKGGVADGLDVGESVEWAHARISQLVTAIERAVGINVAATMPPAPGKVAEKLHTEVIGAESSGS